MSVHAPPNDRDLSARHAGRAERRVYPAAVIAEGAPGAENVARVVPTRALERKIGGATAGYVVEPVRTVRLAPIQGRAAKRLAELAALASWRARWGVVSDPKGWALVAADALRVLEGVAKWSCDRQGIESQLPPAWLMTMPSMPR
jgi:hypothetical protein